MFRNEINYFPPFFYKYFAGDIMLYFLLSVYGKLYYSNKVIGVYRIHEKGITKIVPPINKHISRIKMNNEMDSFFKMKYSNKIKKANKKSNFFDQESI